MAEYCFNQSSACHHSLEKDHHDVQVRGWGLDCTKIMASIKLAANLCFLFKDKPLLERFGAAAAAGE